MLTYEPHDGGFGSPAQCLDEARALVASLEDAHNVKDLFESFPQALNGLCAPRGDRILLDVHADGGHLQIVAKEAPADGVGA